MTDIDTLKETEARLRAADSNAHASLRTKRTELETAAADDVAAASAALLAGESIPKPRAVKLHAEIRDIESRVILAVDEALWGIVAEVREAVKPDVDEQILTKNLRRWQPPDPGRKDRPAPTHNLAHRPADVVDWVLGKIAAVERSQAKRHDEAERAERKRAAEVAVNRAQTLYNAGQQRLLEEADARKTPTARMHAQVSRQAQPWAPFDRRAFLEREGLLEAYGYVQPGQSIQVQGGNRQEVEFVPASEMTNHKSTPA